MSREDKKQKKVRRTRKAVSPVAELQAKIESGEATVQDLAERLKADGVLKETSQPASADSLPPPTATVQCECLPKEEIKTAKKTRKLNYWKIIPGALLVAVGLFSIPMYLADRNNYLPVILMMFGVGGGGYLLYTGIAGIKTSVLYGSANGKKKYTGRENAIVIYARRDPVTKKDIPVGIEFEEIKQIPDGAEFHELRNNHKHYYELMNVTTSEGGRTLIPVRMPDKKPFPPELFRIPSAMQPYKDYMDYSPPTLMQKIAPAILVGCMFLVGILITITTSPKPN